jgi:hypothetical protein
MDYLFAKLFWYLVVAFVIGLFVGWVSCARAEE